MTVNASGIQPAIVRSGCGVDRPYPGRSIPMRRNPASAAARRDLQRFEPAPGTTVAPQHRRAIGGTVVREPDRPPVRKLDRVISHDDLPTTASPRPR